MAKPFVHICILLLVMAGMLPIYGQSFDWFNIATDSPRPSARSGHGMVYDPVHAKIVLFGGSDSTGTRNDIWEFDTATRHWTNVTPLSGPMPVPRSTFGMALDENRGVIVIYGGNCGTNCVEYGNVAIVGDTWEWNTSTRSWRKGPNTIPIFVGLRGSALAYDPTRQQVIAFSGKPYWCPYCENRTWAWDGTSWTDITPAISPDARYDHAMVTDTYRNRIVLFGPFEDTWEWDGSQWLPVGQTGPHPTWRWGVKMAYDKVRQKTILFGGSNQYTAFNETWEWDGTTWTQLFPLHSPPGRGFTSLVYDESQNALVMFGGDRLTDDTWISVPVDPLSLWSAEGDANDSIGSNHGSLQNGASFDSGRNCQAFNLDGVNDYVQVPDSPSLNLVQQTLSAWVYLKGMNGLYSGIIVKQNPNNTGRNYYLGVFNGGYLHYSIQYGSNYGMLYGNTRIPLNTWTHVAATYDGSSMKTYINGQADASLNVGAITPQTTTEPLTIGWTNENDARYFYGKIDEARVYDRALNASELQEFVNEPNNGQCPANLVSSWQMDGDVADSVGTNNPSATNAISFETGKICQGVRLSPVNGFIEIPDSPSLRNQRFSVSAWVKPDGAGPNDDLFGRTFIQKSIQPPAGDTGRTMGMWWSAQDNRFRFGVGSPSDVIASANTFPAGQFYNVTGTYDGARLSLYVNGNLEAQISLVTTIPYDTSVPWTIGSSYIYYRSIGFPRTWNGVIDEVQIYNGALNTTQIQEIFNSATTRQCPVFDTIAPISSILISPQPNSAGWNNSNVTVSLSASDNTDGSGIKEITYSATGAQNISQTVVSGASTNLTIAAEGETSVTYFARDNAGNTETAQTLTIRIDKTAPVISNLPSNQTVVATGANGAAVSWSSPTVADNLDPGVTLSCAPASGSIFAHGITTVTCASTDRAGNAASRSFTVEVTNAPPTASAGGPYQVGEGGTVGLSGAGADTEGTALIYAWDLDDDGTFETGVQNPVFSAAGLDGPTSRTIKLRVTDAAGLSAVSSATINVSNVAPTLSSVSGPVAPQAVGTTLNLTFNYTDPAGSLDTYTLTTNWGDGTTDNSASHLYTTPGVYRVRATVTDDDGGVSNEAFYEYVVVYDPEGGFVTGGGWIMSPAGAYAPNPALTGKANFGFVSKYQRGANQPTGNTEFQFQAGDFRFKSDAYEWLVVAGSKAQFKGTGSVNGVPGYRFMLTARDGQANGGGGVDKFRIKIWNDNGVIYDNVRSAADDADPQAIGGGSIVIHSDR